jgi:uncharacterized protein (DUF1330 family)
MAVYYIGTYDIENMEEFQKYPPRVAAILPRYGGEVLASDLKAVTLEGVSRTMNAIIKFPSMEAALGMYNDPEYQGEIKQIRINSTKNCTMVLVNEFKRS